MPLLSGDIMIDSDNGERCQVNWVKEGKAGVSYLDEPWYPGSMVVQQSILLECENNTAPVRMDAGWKRVKAIGEKGRALPDPEDDPLLQILAA